MSRIDHAIEQVSSSFPIDGYMTPIKAGGAYATVAGTALKYLAPGASILDFGCGPCDKTAILQQLGFRCAGFDDLEEDWHKHPGQRESILCFARNAGIEFRLSSGNGLPFDAERFNMVMLHDVLEHIHDSPRELLNDLLELAKPEGLLFITVPNQVNIKKRVEVLLGRTNLTAYETFYWSDIPWRGHVREYVKGRPGEAREIPGTGGPGASGRGPHAPENPAYPPPRLPSCHRHVRRLEGGISLVKRTTQPQPA